MKIDITSEIQFQTARSGGKGGQNVNKVETLVQGRWHILSSKLLSDDQKIRIQEKLANRITTDGDLMVKSQESRSQLENKSLVIEKLNDLVAKAMLRKKARMATKPSKAAIEKRIESKKKKSEHKSFRKKIDHRNL